MGIKVGTLSDEQCFELVLGYILFSELSETSSATNLRFLCEEIEFGTLASDEYKDIDGARLSIRDGKRYQSLKKVRSVGDILSDEEVTERATKKLPRVCLKVFHTDRLLQIEGILDVFDEETLGVATRAAIAFRKQKNSAKTLVAIFERARTAYSETLETGNPKQQQEETEAKSAKEEETNTEEFVTVFEEIQKLFKKDTLSSSNLIEIQDLFEMLPSFNESSKQEQTEKMCLLYALSIMSELNNKLPANLEMTMVDALMTIEIILSKLDLGNVNAEHVPGLTLFADQVKSFVDEQREKGEDGKVSQDDLVYISLYESINELTKDFATKPKSKKVM